MNSAFLAAAPDVLPPMLPVEVRRPPQQTAALVFASAHAGRDYSPGFIAAARLNGLALRRSEDSFVDELFEAAPSLGAPLVVANFPRAFCDANREKWELDPAMFVSPLPSWVNTTSARVGAGLGTIARVVASGEPIYRKKLEFSEAEARISACWQPFHDALSAEIAATHAQFGRCLLIDCHSMPGNSQIRGPRVDIILGDLHGTSCAPEIVQGIEQQLTALGYSVRRNEPYAGGYITRHYGRPREGVHALQIEICRTLYMNEQRIERLAGFAVLQAHLASLIAAMVASDGILTDF